MTVAIEPFHRVCFIEALPARRASIQYLVKFTDQTLVSNLVFMPQKKEQIGLHRA